MRGKGRFATPLVLALVLAAPVRGQIGSGDVYGSVTDASERVLPGASVELSGPFSRRTVTDATGRFRLLRLDAGRYRLRVSLPGFETVEQALVVTTGQDVTLEYRLDVAQLSEELTVVAESPVVDAKRVGTQTTLVKDEAVRTPNARDIWAVLRTVPGVVTSGTNLAGENAGQQLAFNGKGAARTDNTWSLDGVQIDDMSAGGATPTYFDFDFFEEVAVTTGGNPVDIQTGGIGLNFVTKRGTNAWHGSAKGYLTHDDLQWSNLAGTELEDDPRLQLEGGGFARNAFHVEQISDWGVDLGGPLVRDRLFVYGLYGRQDIRHRQIDQNRDKTLLETFTAKLNWQISDRTSASAFWFNGKKTKIGRPQFSGLSHDETALHDQGMAYEGFLPFDIHGMLKFDLSHVFGPRFMLHGSYTNYDTGFALRQRDSGPGTIDFSEGEVRGSGWVDVAPILRPQKHVSNLEGNWFLTGWGGEHELKFGLGYKEAPVSSSSAFGGRDEGLLGLRSGPDDAVVWVSRPGELRFEGRFFHAWASDTWTRDRMSATLGVRFDHQRSENSPAAIPASPTFPELLPAIDYPGGGVGVQWNDVSPRLGLTLALDDRRRTVARGSFATYAGKLRTWLATTDNPVVLSYLAYLWNDLNGDGLPQAAEVDLDSGLQYYGGVDPASPASPESADTIDPDHPAPRDYELVLGVDHELLPELAAGVAYTWRRGTRISWRPRIGLTSADYTANEPVTVNDFTGQTFSPAPDLVSATGGGRIRTVRPDYHRGYHGLELTLRKRMSRGWMMRAAFSWMDWREFLDGPGAFQNPTRTDVFNEGMALGGPGVDGGPVPTAGASVKGGARFYTAIRWQLAANGLVELPAGFEVGASLFGRQGHPRPIVVVLPAGLDGQIPALATDGLDERRYPDVWHLDLRFGKRLRLGGTSLLLEASVFNVFNSNTELVRFWQAQARTFPRLEGILSPRIVRLGARLTF